MSNMEARRGFTTLELLIAIGVIAVLGALAVWNVSAARSRARDAVRVAQVSRVQSALEEYFSQNNKYPDGQALPLGEGAALCLGKDGFAAACTGAAFLNVVSASDPAGLKGLATCGDPAHAAFCYSQSSNGAGYVIDFELENAVPEAGLGKGVVCATKDGIGRCDRL
jgi:prepilin-type N-terminal cleavage/methylation domain-containing protein